MLLQCNKYKIHENKSYCSVYWSSCSLLSKEQKHYWLDQGHEAVLDDITLSFGQRTATGQSVDGVQHGVNHDGTVVSTRKQRSALGQKRQHGGTQITIKGQGHLCGTECHLKTNRDSVVELHQETLVQTEYPHSHPKSFYISKHLCFDVLVPLICHEINNSLPCPEMLRPSYPGGSRLPARATGSLGYRCRTLCLGTTPWRPCGLGQNWQTSWVRWSDHLWKGSTLQKASEWILKTEKLFSTFLHCILLAYLFHSLGSAQEDWWLLPSLQ